MKLSYNQIKMCNIIKKHYIIFRIQLTSLCGFLKQIEYENVVINVLCPAVIIAFFSDSKVRRSEIELDIFLLYESLMR